jgi:hypothetical protein
MKWVKFYIFLSILLFSNSILAFRCGNKLISVGDYKNDVYEKCGAPESVDTHTEVAVNTFNFPRRTIGQEYYTEIQVEIWIYNFGSLRFKQYLRFENGVLVDIKSLGKGN